MVQEMKSSLCCGCCSTLREREVIARYLEFLRYLVMSGKWEAEEMS